MCTSACVECCEMHRLLEFFLKYEHSLQPQMKYIRCCLSVVVSLSAYSVFYVGVLLMYTNNIYCEVLSS